MEQHRETKRNAGPPEAGGLTIVACPIHGIAFDVEREACPECAKGQDPAAVQR